MKKLMRDGVAVTCIVVLGAVIVMGIFAPLVAPNDPYEQNITNRYASISVEHPLGTDNLGRCVFSRIVYGIRTTVFLSLVTMACTIAVGTVIGLVAGYFEGPVDETIMRLCDVMLSFPSQVMILVIVGVLGIGIENVIIANVVIKWAWYARMIRGAAVTYRHKNYVLYSRAIGTPSRFILFRHILPNILSEIIVLATLDMGWVVLSISGFSFLGIGVQPPTPEWGAMLNEAKNVMHTNPALMVPAGAMILIVVACCNLLGDSLRDALDPKEASA